MKQKMEIKDINLIDTNTKSILVRISFNCLSKFKRLPVVYVTIYQKKVIKTSDKSMKF